MYRSLHQTNEIKLAKLLGQRSNGRRFRSSRASKKTENFGDNEREKGQRSSHNAFILRTARTKFPENQPRTMSRTASTSSKIRRRSVPEFEKTLPRSIRINVSLHRYHRRIVHRRALSVYRALGAELDGLFCWRGVTVDTEEFPQFEIVQVLRATIKRLLFGIRSDNTPVQARFAKFLYRLFAKTRYYWYKKMNIIRTAERKVALYSRRQRIVRLFHYVKAFDSTGKKYQSRNEIRSFTYSYIDWGV